MLTPSSVAAARHVAVPIFMYHHIEVAPAGSRSSDLYVSPATFAVQMRWLYAHGYHAVTLSQLFDFWEYGTPMPRNPVVLTFDDGWKTAYTGAAPILAQYDWPGVINEVVWSVDAPYCMSRQMLETLIDRGWEIASHTVSHKDLSRLSAAALMEQISSSRARLERTLHTAVSFFCYPGGVTSSAAIQDVQAAGYRGATGVWGGLGRWGERWNLHRICATEHSFNIPSN